MKLYGLSEIADATGDKLNTVSQWYKRGKLPEPDQLLKMGPVWSADTIRPWIRQQKKAREAARRLARTTGGLTGLMLMIVVGMIAHVWTRVSLHTALDAGNVDDIERAALMHGNVTEVIDDFGYLVGASLLEADTHDS